MYASDVLIALASYNDETELPEGYWVKMERDTQTGVALALYAKNLERLLYLPNSETMDDCYNAIIHRAGLPTVRAVAWQHALEGSLTHALDLFPKIASTVVTSASGLTSVELYKLPLPSGPRFVAAEITITRGPITFKSHARDVSIGQIVAAIAG
jgi:hypothetical protein